MDVFPYWEGIRACLGWMFSLVQWRLTFIWMGWQRVGGRGQGDGAGGRAAHRGGVVAARTMAVGGGSVTRGGGGGGMEWPGKLPPRPRR